MRAISMAIDRQNQVDTAFEGHRILGGASPISTTRTRHRRRLSLNPWWQCRPADAKRLLVEAGHPNGFETTLFYYEYFPQMTSQVQLVQQDLKKNHNIDVKITKLDYTTYYGRYVDRKWDGIAWGFQSGHAIGLDERTYQFMHSKSTKNFSRVNDPIIDELSTKLRQTPDRAEQRTLTKKLVDRELDQVLRMWMPYDGGFLNFQPRIRNGAALALRRTDVMGRRQLAGCGSIDNAALSFFRSLVASGRIAGRTASSARSSSSSTTSAPVWADQCTTAAVTWCSLTEACASTRATGTCFLVMPRRPWRSSRCQKLSRAKWSSLFKVSSKTSSSSALFFGSPELNQGRCSMSNVGSVAEGIRGVVLFKRWIEQFSNDIAIDLGTANTLVFVRGQGIVLDEPSIVALREPERSIIAVGRDAKAMLGRTPGNICVIRPLKDGVIADFDVAQKMLGYFISQTPQRNRTILRPRVVLGVPSGISQVERRAVRDAARQAGAREVYLVEEPVAAAIGAGLPIQKPGGNLIVDIGGGTTEVAVLSFAGVVKCRSVRIAGDTMDEAILQYIRKQYGILIGVRQAEEIKITLGSAYPGESDERMQVKGRDLVQGVPKVLVVAEREIREALRDPVMTIVETVRTCLEQAPPELAADIVDTGIVITGGGGLLRGLDRLFERETQLPVAVAKDPMSCVALGLGSIFDDLELLENVALPA